MDNRKYVTMAFYVDTISYAGYHLTESESILPCFTKAQCETILRAVSTNWHYDSDLDMIVATPIWDSEAKILSTGFDIMINGESIHVYSLGDYTWWQEQDPYYPVNALSNGLDVTAGYTNGSSFAFESHIVNNMLTVFSGKYHADTDEFEFNLGNGAIYAQGFDIVLVDGSIKHIYEINVNDWSATYNNGQSASFRKANVTIDDSRVYPAIVSNRTWNGWAIPYFTKETAIQICQDSGIWYLYDESNLTLVTSATLDSNSDELDDYEESIIALDGIEYAVYPLGAGSWIWDVVESPAQPMVTSSQDENALRSLINEMIMLG